MSLKYRTGLAVASLAVGCSAFAGCGGNAESVGGFSTVSDAIDAGYVQVPGVGAVHPSCVHTVADDSVLDLTTKTLTYPDGRQEALPPRCAYGVVTGSESAQNASELAGGWMAAGIFESNRQVGSLTADYGVPQNPHSVSEPNHTFVAEFPSLEHRWTTPEYIIQPVLQWNQLGFRNAWSIVAEAGGDAFGGHYFMPNPQRTATNHTIRGQLLGSGCNATYCTTWKIVVTDLNTGKSSNFTVVRNNWGLAAVAGGALEAYGISRCTDLPASWTRFYNVAVHDWSGRPISPPWQHWVNISSCGDWLWTDATEVHVHP